MPDEEHQAPSKAAIHGFLERVRLDSSLSTEVREALIADLTSDHPTDLARLTKFWGSGHDDATEN
jgi:hypothetical protein